MGQNVARYGGRRKLAVAALALGLGVAACSSGAGKNAVSLKDTSGQAGKPAAPGAGGPTSPTGATGGAPVSGGTGGTVTGSPTPATTTTPGSATTAPAHATATTATTVAKPTTPAAGGPAPTPPGSYQYNLVSGSSTLTMGSSKTTLPVAATNPLVVSATGSGTEQWANASGTTRNLVFNKTGVFLQSETVSYGTTTLACTFSSPVPWPPWPLTVGKTFAGQATCAASGQPSATLRLTGGQVVGGGSVSPFAVQSTMTLAGTNLTIVEKDWYGPSQILPVRTTVGVTGSFTVSSTSYSVVSATTYDRAS